MAVIEVTTLLAAVRQCVTIVEPGEILAVRVAYGTSETEMEYLGEQAQRIREQCGVRVAFVLGEEFARLKAGDAA
jgi:hypothetical protein